MFVYFVGTALSAFFAFVSTNLKCQKRLNNSSKYILTKIFAFLSFVPLTAIMAFRYDVGTDYMSYYRFFYSMPKYVESGYRFLNDCIKSFSNNPQSVFIVSAVIICGCYIYMIYKESVSPVYSILLFVLCKDYFIAMNGMRQYIATAIMILALTYIKEKKIFQSLSFLVIAFLFHKSVIIFVPLYILYIIEIPPLVSGIAIISTFSLSFVIRDFVFPILARLGFYDNYFMSTFANTNENFKWIETLIFLCFFILLAYDYRNVKSCKELKLLYSGIVLGLLITSLSAVMPTNFTRLTWYMNPLIVIYLPLAIKKLDLKISETSVNKLISAAILIAYAMVTAWQINYGNQTVLPYQTIWSR